MMVRWWGAGGDRKAAVKAPQTDKSVISDHWETSFAASTHLSPSADHKKDCNNFALATITHMCVKLKKYWQNYKTRVGLDFVTIQNRILKLNSFFLVSGCWEKFVWVVEATAE